MTDQPHAEMHPEEDVIPVRAVLLAIAGTLLIGSALVVLAGLLLVAWRGTIRPSGLYPEENLNPPHTVDGVRQGVFSLQFTGADRDAAARRTLSRWSFVDEKQGIVRMPIDRAIELELDKKEQR